MAPKRSSTPRAMRSAKRSRAAQRGRDSTHSRILSDIIEESPVASIEPSDDTALPPSRSPRRQTKAGSKKRTLAEAGIEDFQDAAERSQANPQRPVREPRSKRARTFAENTLSSPPATASPTPSPRLVQRFTNPDAPYIPSADILSFATWHDLDASPDTLTLTLNLIDFTLQAAYWHPVLSGMIQPTACFLVASILTQMQNLVEDVIAAAERFGVGWSEILGGYGVLWEERMEFAGIAGEYAGLLEELPAPWEFEGSVVDEQDESRMEPERGVDAVLVG